MSMYDQVQRTHQASLKAEEVLHGSNEPLRKAERNAKEATHRAEELKWMVDGSGIRPRRPAARQE
jgi:hypothetical protein